LALEKYLADGNLKISRSKKAIHIQLNGYHYTLHKNKKNEIKSIYRDHKRLPYDEIEQTLNTLSNALRENAKDLRKRLSVYSGPYEIKVLSNLF